MASALECLPLELLASKVLVGHGLVAEDLSRLEQVATHFWRKRPAQFSIVVGSKVSVHGLTSDVGLLLNGLRGTVSTFDHGKGRFLVKLRKGGDEEASFVSKWILPANVVHANQSVVESAAQLALMTHTLGWRVVPREDETWTQALFVCNSRLALPRTVAAGERHTLFMDFDTKRVGGFGCGTFGQLLGGGYDGIYDIEGGAESDYLPTDYLPTDVRPSARSFINPQF